ncbi:MAG: replication-relaxation family protein [Deltaproteobacteria bacterium]|nr:replication-relaxation family protein [Deltaproteobacteria bacterium]
MRGRASKWERKKNPERLILQPRDRELIVTIYAFRFLTREQIQRLFGFNCIRRVNLRLRKLYDHQYLSRTFLPTIRGSAKALYYPGPKGVPIIAEELGKDPSLIKKKIKGISQLKEFFLAHALQLNEVRITFTQAIQKNPGISLERWINDNDCEQEYRINSSGKTIRKRFRPDGYFRFYYQGKVYSFFLELDRSTMTLGRFKRKVLTYLEFARLGYYRQRFGVKYFRVLVIAPTGERLSHLKEAVEEITDKIFWFTTFDQISVDKVFGPIWQRAGSQEFFPLIGS